MGKVIQGRQSELLVVSTLQGESKKKGDNFGREYLSVTCADEYGNNVTIFNWTDELQETELAELSTWKRGDTVTETKSYNNMA